MGYYMAGDGASVADPMGLYGNRGVGPKGSGPAATNQTPPQDKPRRKTRVINLTALSRAERRIERATRVAARLFAIKKHGTHGLKLKRHRRKAKGI
jgi:hypothetical protein